MISQRTKDALAAAKARGVKLGLNGARIAAQRHRDAVAYAATLKEHVRVAEAPGAKTLTAIAVWLNQNGVPSREGKRWHHSFVARNVRRLKGISSCPPLPAPFDVAIVNTFPLCHRQSQSRFSAITVFRRDK